MTPTEHAIKLLRSGASVNDAARQAGISPQTARALRQLHPAQCKSPRPNRQRKPLPTRTTAWGEDALPEAGYAGLLIAVIRRAHADTADDPDARAWLADVQAAAEDARYWCGRGVSMRQNAYIRKLGKLTARRVF